MLVLDKMQDISTLMCKSSESKAEHFASYSSFLYYLRIVLYFGCSDPVIGSSTAYILILFRPLLTGTMPLTAQILHTAINSVQLWKYTNFLFPHLFV